MRPDYENLPPAILDQIKSGGSGEFSVKRGVREILEDGGFNASNLEAAIWSHWHFDHVGDPSTFDPHTALIVGPGFKEKIAPGYPANPNSTILEADYAGRELRELSFEGEGVVKIGQFRAFDYFGDGSYFLIDMPGHAVGHMGGLARVTSNPDSFIFMGGDSCHHLGELRPSRYHPLPQNISPNPFTSFTAPKTPCPGALFEKILRDGNHTQPFYRVSDIGVHYDVKAAADTIEKLQAADRDNILVVVAHDQTLTGVVDLFPKTANRFLEKGWTKKLRWLFLRDFANATGYEGVVEGRSPLFEKWNNS